MSTDAHHFPFFAQIKEKFNFDGQLYELGIELDQSEKIVSTGIRGGDAPLLTKVRPHLETFVGQKLGEVLERSKWKDFDIPIEIKSFIVDQIQFYLYPQLRKNESYLCSCFAVTKADIEELYRRDPEMNLAKVKELSFIGMGCESCEKFVSHLFDNQYFKYSQLKNKKN